MALVKWRMPSAEMDRLERRMRRLFDAPFHLDVFGDEVGWSPAVELSETDDAISLTVELPGMSTDDVEISLQNNTLTVRGEKKSEHEEKEKERYMYERFYGSFQRSFRLPASVQEDAVTAEFRNGVLKVILPKSIESQGRKIAING
jgi:HSP20 family protein